MICTSWSGQNKSAAGNNFGDLNKRASCSLKRQKTLGNASKISIRALSLSSLKTQTLTYQANQPFIVAQGPSQQKKRINTLTNFRSLAWRICKDAKVHSFIRKAGEGHCVLSPDNECLCDGLSIGHTQSILSPMMKKVPVYIQVVVPMVEKCLTSYVLACWSI